MLHKLIVLLYNAAIGLAIGSILFAGWGAFIAPIMGYEVYRAFWVFLGLVVWFSAVTWAVIHVFYRPVPAHLQPIK